MLQILGKLLLFGGMSFIGLQMTLGLYQRVACLRAFLLATERAERDLAFSLPPVEALLEEMGKGSGGPVAAFFQHCRTRFLNRREERLEEIWSTCLVEAKLPLKEGDRNLVMEIGGVLGRYDGDSQRLALSRIHGRLEEALEGAREEAARLGRVYGALGVTAGLFCVIVL